MNYPESKKKDLRFWLIYFILVTIASIYISLAPSIFYKVLILLGLIFLWVTYVFISSPLLFLLFYFATIPFCHPFFYSGFLNLGEMLSVGTMLFILIAIKEYENFTIEFVKKYSELFMAILIFIFFGLISSVVNKNSAGGLISNLIAMVFKPIFITLLTIYITIFLKKFKGTNFIFVLLIIVTITSTMEGLITFYSLIKGSPLWAIDITAERIRGTFATYNLLSGFALLMFFLTWGLLGVSKNLLVRSFLYFSLILTLLTLIGSQTLGGILGFIFGIGTLIFMSKNRGRNFLIASISLVVLTLIFYYAYPPIFYKFMMIGNRIRDRLTVNYAGMNIIKSFFWFGTGEPVMNVLIRNQWLRNTPFGQSFAVPHNAWLYTFAQGGVFYFIAFIYTVFVIFKNVFKVIPTIQGMKNSIFYKSLLAGLNAFLFQNISNNLFWHPRLGNYFFLFIAILISLKDDGEIVFPERF